MDTGVEIKCVGNIVDRRQVSCGHTGYQDNITSRINLSKLGLGLGYTELTGMEIFQMGLAFVIRYHLFLKTSPVPARVLDKNVVHFCLSRL